jgi:hypothetical protein
MTRRARAVQAAAEARPGQAGETDRARQAGRPRKGQGTGGAAEDAEAAEGESAAEPRTPRRVSADSQSRKAAAHRRGVRGRTEGGSAASGGSGASPPQPSPQQLAQQVERVRRAFPSWNRSMLTETYLCHACSHHEIENGNAGQDAFDRRPGGYYGPKRHPFLSSEAVRVRCRGTTQRPPVHACGCGWRYWGCKNADS